MISLSRCIDLANLAPNELLVGVAPAARHYSLLAGYALNLGRGAGAVRELIRSDLAGYIDLGAKARAADLLLILRLFLSDYPEATESHEQEVDRSCNCPDIAKWLSPSWQKFPLLMDNLFEPRITEPFEFKN